MDSLVTSLVVQIEKVGGQYLSARLLPPWKSLVVARDWKEAESKLRSKAVRELGRGAPHKWLMSDLLTTLPSESKTKIEIEPPERGQAWRQSVTFELATFRWELPDEMSLVKVPALKCELFGKREEIDAAAIAGQVRVALIRLGEKFDLWDLRQTFFQRAYEYRTLRIETPPRRVEPSTQSAAAKERKQTVTLRSTASDLTRAELDPIYGRDKQASEVAEYFLGQSAQSVLLVGPAGVGKTALVHRLVQMAEQLGINDRKIWSTTGSRLVSGMSGLGMWQERCLKLLREVHSTRAILHVGSVVELMEAGKIEGQPGVASMIRQAIARGRVVVIAECTPEQLSLVEREEPLLLRAMVRYDLIEPTVPEITSILTQAAEYRTKQSSRKSSEQSHFTQPALEELTRLHKRYATYSAMPAQPLRLMQTILERSAPASTIEAADVARAFASQTGLPRFLVDDSMTIDLNRIRERLSTHVIGQSEPVELVVNLIATLKSRLVRPGRPLASLLFIGPTGVGKTEMAKALAGLLYSDTRRMIRIDMSEYASPWSAVRLIGRPDEGDGTLTSPIREQPFSVVLLDEFEKADPSVFDMLLQLLGEGRLTDSLGRLADFRNAVVVMTSNLGVESFRGSGFGFAESCSDWRSHFQREVERFVRPELLGRIDRIVPFAPLPKDVVRQIALRELEMLKDRPGLKYHDIQLDFAPELVDHVCEVGYVPKYGARPLRRAIEQHVAVPLANSLTELDLTQAWTLEVRRTADKVQVNAQRRSTNRTSERQSAEVAIDAWQRIGRMARLAMNCSPLRDLENETQRLQRVNDSLQDKLKVAANTRRQDNLKNEIQQNSVVIERNRILIDGLNATSQKIIDAHLLLMWDWHRNVKLEPDRLFEQPDRLQSELRAAVLSIVDGRFKKDAETVTLMIVGKPIAMAAVLWQAYEQIALESRWNVVRYTLKNYDASRDKSTPEFRRRAAANRSDSQADPEDPLPDAEVCTRAHGTGSNAGSASNTLTKVCHAYFTETSDPWATADKSVLGVALQITGLGVSAWLDNEPGIMHFVEGSTAASRGRRRRYRVMLEPTVLSQVELPSNWQDVSGPPDRDPRRTFVASELIHDALSDIQSVCGQSSMRECLVSMIQDERERSLWQAIDYNGIPGNATLSGDHLDENPF